MLYVRSGSLKFSVDAAAQSQHVSHGDFVNEEALWTHWECRGELRATADVLLICVGAREFTNVIQAFPLLRPRMLRYACEFVSLLNASYFGDRGSLRCRDSR